MPVKNLMHPRQAMKHHRHEDRGVATEEKEGHAVQRALAKVCVVLPLPTVRHGSVGPCEAGSRNDTCFLSHGSWGQGSDV